MKVLAALLTFAIWMAFSPITTSATPGDPAAIRATAAQILAALPSEVDVGHMEGKQQTFYQQMRRRMLQLSNSEKMKAKKVNTFALKAVDYAVRKRKGTNTVISDACYNTFKSSATACASDDGSCKLNALRAFLVCK